MHEVRLLKTALCGRSKHEVRLLKTAVCGKYA